VIDTIMIIIGDEMLLPWRSSNNDGVITAATIC